MYTLKAVHHITCTFESLEVLITFELNALNHKKKTTTRIANNVNELKHLKRIYIHKYTKIINQKKKRNKKPKHILSVFVFLIIWKPCGYPYP